MLVHSTLVMVFSSIPMCFVWRVLVMLLIFLLCACASSVGHGVAFSSYMLVCMMLIMVLLYVL